MPVKNVAFSQGTAAVSTDNKDPKDLKDSKDLQSFVFRPCGPCSPLGPCFLSFNDLGQSMVQSP